MLYIKNEAKEIAITPNPVASVSQIQLPEGIVGQLKIDLFDMNGRLVKTSSTQMNGNPLSFNINMSDQKPGSYVLKLSGPGLSYSRQLVKE